ncbi:MAG: hypothetical protein CMJ83_20060 [Planctomycetes bacterium]|nr:hypothetical protein [Planctomycetota bacterium]
MQQEPEFQEEDWPEDEEDTGRSFLYKELVLSGLYSPKGNRGFPLDDGDSDHFEISPRPPGNYFGLEFVKTFTEFSPINRDFMPDWLPITGLNLHPRLVFDGLEENDGFEKIKFAPQDFWVRFNPGGADRWALRLGQFVIPYGVTPTLAPRQRFILPIEAADLGLKWDWGVGLKGPVGEYDWEVAATLGSGEGIHSPRWGDDDRERWLVTGRIGTPNYWDFQYGLSFLYGDLPVIRGPKAVSKVSLSRWRLGLDTFYRYDTWLVFGGQVTFGQDGHAGDERFIRLTGGEPADVLAYRLWLDWVVPSHPDLKLSAQYESVIRDLSTSHSDDSALILEASYSLTTSLTVSLDVRFDLNRAMGGENHALFLTFVYYGL